MLDKDQIEAARGIALPARSKAVLSAADRKIEVRTTLQQQVAVLGAVRWLHAVTVAGCVFRES